MNTLFFHSARSRSGGFTLIEMIVVIVIAGLVGSMATYFIVRVMQGYDAQARRADLVDAAESVLRRMQRDIRRALPNSVRIACGGQCIEVLHIQDGGRYRANAPGDPLDFSSNIDSFDVIGQLTDIGGALLGGDSTDCVQGNAWCLVIHNVGQPTAPPGAGNSGNAYHGASNVYDGNIATISAIAPTTISFDNDDLGNWNFAFTSVGQRFYIVDTPITYLCDTAVTAQTLTRFSGYAIVVAQPTDPGIAPLAAANSIALAADHVTGCTFTYQAGTSQRAGLVTLDLTIADVNTSERVRLLHQVHVDNVP